MVLFFGAGLFQILYSNLASKIIKQYGIKLKLKKFSTYSYSRKYLKELQHTCDNPILSRKVSKLLVYEIISIGLFVATFVLFIVLNILF